MVRQVIFFTHKYMFMSSNKICLYLLFCDHLYNLKLIITHFLLCKDIEVLKTESKKGKILPLKKKYSAIATTFIPLLPSSSASISFLANRLGSQTEWQDLQGSGIWIPGNSITQHLITCISKFPI